MLIPYLPSSRLSRTITQLQLTQFRAFSSTICSNTARHVPRVPAPSLEDFRTRILPSSQPYILTSALTTWPALVKWQNLRAMYQVEGAAQLVVPVEVSALSPGETVGRGYNSTGCEQMEMPFSAFMEAFMLREPVPNETRYVGYLAQYALLDSIPKLKEDVSPALPYTQSARGDEWRTNVWIGTAGTFTPIHKDPYHNLFCQVVGSKHIRVFSPEIEDKLYISRDPLRRNTSRIEVPEPEMGKYPLFAEALKMSWEAIVNPEDVLFIPRGFYHSVQGLTKSVSVNSWFL